MENDLRKRLKVIVVDDSATVRHHLVETLSPAFDCVAFGDAAAALRWALENPPDFIVSDVVMEPMDGYELCKRVRAEPTLRDTPFILLTSQGDPDGRAMGLEGGADDYLSKPIRYRELFARVRYLLRLREANQEIRRHQAAVSSSHAELMRTQNQLLEAEKLCTLGTLASGLAHELNNPISFIRSGVSQLMSIVEELASPELGAEARREAMRDFAEISVEVNGGIDRVSGIVKQVGLMAHETRSPVPVDVREEVLRAIEMTRERLHNLTVREDFGQGCTLPLASGYVAQIALTLLTNAVDAVQGVKNPEIHVSSRQVEKGVQLTVRDNGGGIHPDLLPQIFEPFFTSKRAGRGSGLGLSVCRVLTRRLGGEVSVKTQWGAGSEFTVFLPSAVPEGDGGFNRIRHAAVTLGRAIAAKA